MAHTLYELDVRLREIEPAIWRTVEIAGLASLEEVHFAIQVAMGWTNSHLHQFVIGDKSYGMLGPDGDHDLEVEDERTFRLQDLVREGGTFRYEYDFGDGWEHDVTVMRVSSPAKASKPRCIGGARACPPEDCGGPGGYANLLEVLRDPKHADHKSAVEWSANFQPERFAIPKAGLDLQKAMTKLAAMANGDEAGDDELDLEENDEVALPKLLVEAVLALAPMQRASLAAVIAGSLANELLEIHDVARQLAAALKKQPKTDARHGHKRAR